jgi:hypothetical protein
MTLLTDNLIDTPITEFKYYQSRNNLTIPIYGLYEPVSDRFLIILQNENIAKQLKYILSSRYNLHICRVDVASNYKDTYINDNNCDKWTLSNREDINFSNPIMSPNIVVKELRPADIVPQYNVLNEKVWCFFCKHWLYILNNETDWPDYRWLYSKLDDYLNSFLNIKDTQFDNHHYKQKLSLVKNDILKLLYLSRDFKSTELAIEKLVHE